MPLLHMPIGGISRDADRLVSLGRPAGTGGYGLDRPVFTIRGSRRGAGEAGHGQEPARGEPLSPTPSFPYFFAL